MCLARWVDWRGCSRDCFRIYAPASMFSPSSFSLLLEPLVNSCIWGDGDRSHCIFRQLQIHPSTMPTPLWDHAHTNMWNRCTTTALMSLCNYARCSSQPLSSLAIDFLMQHHWSGRLLSIMNESARVSDRMFTQSIMANKDVNKMAARPMSVCLAPTLMVMTLRKPKRIAARPTFMVRLSWILFVSLFFSTFSLLCLWTL